MNTEIIKCHFKALITVPDTYSKGSFEYFERKFPNPHVTAQRINRPKTCHPRKAYGKVKGKLRGGWLSTVEVEAIEAEANILYDNDESSQNRNEEVLTGNVENLSTGNTDEIQGPETDEARAIITKIKTEFGMTNVTGFDKRKDFQNLPSKFKKILKESITKTNNVLKESYIIVNDFTEQSSLLYAFFACFLSI